MTSDNAPEKEEETYPTSGDLLPTRTTNQPTASKALKFKTSSAT
jgi:hypothetical protein